MRVIPISGLLRLTVSFPRTSVFLAARAPTVVHLLLARWLGPPRTLLGTTTPLTLRSVDVASTSETLSLLSRQWLAPRVSRRRSRLARAWTRSIRRLSLSPWNLIIRSRTPTTSILPRLPLHIRLAIRWARCPRPVQSTSVPPIWCSITICLNGWWTQLVMFTLQVCLMSWALLVVSTITIGTLLRYVQYRTICSILKLLTLGTTRLSSISVTLACSCRTLTVCRLPLVLRHLQFLFRTLPSTVWPTLELLMTSTPRPGLTLIVFCLRILGCRAPCPSLDYKKSRRNSPVSRSSPLPYLHSSPP